MDNDRVLELLEAADWDYIIIRLTYYALYRFKRYDWQSNLPKGNSPADVVLNAIRKVWDGTREWDPDKYPDLLKHLKWIVKSDIEHLHSSLEHMATGRYPVAIMEDGTRVELKNPTCEHPHSISARTLTPEEELIAKQKKERENTLMAELHDAVKGDEDLELLLLYFEDGIDRPDAIAGETGWDIKTVYNLKRKLLRKATKIGEKVSVKEEL